MLIRISGGREGIKEYLEEGHKQGREFSRDELDERVILAGDLEFAQQLIDGIEIDGERYLHITLSFKEDEIPNETLRAIAEDFRRFMFSAYEDDEYNFYAEAHLPKIKSYEHQTTGEIVERKPHIHIVVPKTNLRTGGALNPFGLVEWSERHIDATQEHINNKYGLASPKDNRRIEFTDASDMIARYKDDNFAGAKKDFKQTILQTVLDADITSYDEFKKLIAEFGAVRVRNNGKPNEYLNVKYTEDAARDDLAEHRFARKFKHVEPGSAKGVNLKENVFSRTFIELPGAQKRAVLSAEIQRTYDIAGQVRKDPTNIAARLDEWHRFRAKEVKYLNSGNKKQYQAYRAAAPAEREQMLAQLATRFYDKYPAPAVEPGRFTGRDPFEPGYGFKTPAQPLDRAAGAPGPDRGAAGAQPAGEVDRFGRHPARQQEAGPLAGFENTNTINDVPRTPAGQHALPAPRQEPHHEPERNGKNPVGHQYGFKQPVGGSGRNTSQERSRGPSGLESGGPGAFDQPGGQRVPGGRGSGGRAGFVPAPGWQYDARSLAVVEKTTSINRLRSVPGGLVVQPGRESGVLLPDHAPGQLGIGRKAAHHGLRRPRDRGQRGGWQVSGTGRAYDSVVSQVARDFTERQRSGHAGGQPEFQEIKQNLDARRLLAELSRSHGVMVDKYQVIQASDGSARIRCGTRNLNVCDYLTKEVRLPWAEAATILRHSYGRQLDRHPETAPRFAPDRALWRQFQDQRRARGGLRSLLSKQLASEQARRDGIKQRLDQARGAAAGLPAADRKAALSVARMEFVAASDALRSAIRAERAPFRLPVADQYRHFLQQQAQDGSAPALDELRRRSNNAPLRHDPAAVYILPVQAQQEPNALLYRGRQVRYRVQHNGDVIYSLGGRAIMHDKGETVMLLQTDRLAVEAALRLAQAKFGDQLKLSGSAEFQERASRIAAEAGLNVRFDNKRAEQIREQRAAELASQRAAGKRSLHTLAKTPPGGNVPAGSAAGPSRGEPGAFTPPQPDRDKDIER
jgi:hypothetical protein